MANYHQLSPYSCGEMDLNTKTEPKNPSAPDEHANAHTDARGIA